MNIYSQKQRWKLLLFVFALVIVGVSLWYTQSLVDKISEEERKKVQIWANAVKKRSSLVSYTSNLFEKLGEGERKKAELYLEATKYLARPDIQDVAFALNVLNDNTTVPVILTNQKGEITSHRNIEIPEGANEDEYLKEELKAMASQYDPVEISYYGNNKVYLYYRDSRLFTELRKTFDDLQESFISELVINAASSPVILVDSTTHSVIEAGNVDTSILTNPERLKEKLAEMRYEHEPIHIRLGGKKALVYYEDSFLLTQLKYYPLAQFGVIGLFILIAYLLFSTARKAEQNQVWVGMSKETAHQLGTPLSSLLAWLEILREEKIDDSVVQEMGKDIARLQTITERFSKIGSLPELSPQNITNVMRNSIEYIRARSSGRVKFELNTDSEELVGLINVPLFEWVIENLFKNALDAMDGKGKISVAIRGQDDKISIDVSDTGKGIPPRQHKTVFQPGYTTKKRGWGLGLSLSKRIISEYHGGKIYVLKSEVGRGTTFRIVIQRG